MHAIHRILVAIEDPSARVQPALIKGAQLAQALGARLELYHALTWPIYASSDQGFESLAASARHRVLNRLRVLADRVQRSARRQSVDVSASWDAPAYEAVIRRAIAARAELIVAEHHHGKHLAPSLRRMTDWELLRHSPVPVLLVRRAGRYRRPFTVLAAVDPNRAPQKPARLDDEILAAGTLFANALGGRLHTVHASGALPLASANGAHNAEDAARRYRKLVSTAQRRYEQLLDRHRIVPAHRHLLNVPPLDAIEDVAQRLHADIVTVGTVSRSGWERWVIGNTAEALLDPLPCDLLVVKPPRFKARIASRPLGPRYQVAVGLVP